MANKLYEEESIRAIADAIRASAPGLAGNHTFTVEQMADAINYSVCDEQYEKGNRAGYDRGLTQGIEKVKTEEARTAADLIFDGHTPKSFNITVPAGYYAKDAKREVDTEYSYDVGYDDGWQEGYDEGYADGLSEGGGSSGDSTTVWEINEAPDLTNLPTAVAPILVNFTSNNTEFAEICSATVMGQKTLRYIKSDGSYITAWNVNLGWLNSAYRTIAFHKVITDETLLSWLGTNTKLISVSGGGGSSEDLEALGALCDWSIMTNSESIPTIYIYNYHPTYYMHCCLMTGIGDIPFYSTEEEDIYPEGGNLVIEPGECLCVTYDNAFSSLDGIEVLDVRWTKDGTI